ncbi:hypothetical protein QQ045_030277 [Rhodiola kirilowii]
MRIRNRPAPSIFPPPPDLNLNRSFPKPQQAVPVQEPSHDDTTAADHHNHAPNLHRNSTHPFSGSSIAFELSSDQLPLATYSLRRSGKVCAKRSTSSSAASIDSDDNDITRDGNSVEDTGVQPFSRTKVDNGWEGEKAGQIIQTSAAKDNSKKAKGVTEKEPSAGILNKGAKIKRVSRVGGAAIMEGSRCSRVNGRGWRCGQQTLVGYSLCEHHLGKSRLRSLTSMKNNNITARSIDHVAVALGSSKKERPGEESDDDDEPLVESRRKKSRIGTVKARSLRSLLGQTSQTNGVSSMSKANNADN